MGRKGSLATILPSNLLEDGKIGKYFSGFVEIKLNSFDWGGGNMICKDVPNNVIVKQSCTGK